MPHKEMTLWGIIIKEILNNNNSIDEKLRVAIQ